MFPENFVLFFDFHQFPGLTGLLKKPQIGEDE
jgi:hypothetical protein